MDNGSSERASSVAQGLALRSHGLKACATFRRAFGRNGMVRTSWVFGLGISALGLSSLLTAAPGSAPLADAAMRGDKATVRSLLKQAVDVSEPQGDGMTALHWAAMKNDADLVQTLLYAGANVKAATRLGSYTPLILAAREGYAAVIEPLLKAGADPNAKTSNGTTALMLAAQSG